MIHNPHWHEMMDQKGKAKAMPPPPAKPVAPQPKDATTKTNGAMSKLPRTEEKKKGTATGTLDWGKAKTKVKEKPAESFQAKPREETSDIKVNAMYLSSTFFTHSYNIDGKA